MIAFRPFLNRDTPALAQLWNRGLPELNVVRPLNDHEFDALVMCKPGFDRLGMILAEREGRVIGFAHAGFGPAQPNGPSHALDTSMGTIAMLVTDPGLDDEEVDRGLVKAAEDYLRSKGARVLYAGGQYPLNPFYWGIYGGSEFSGILGSHTSFHRAVRRCGYEAVSETILLEADLAMPEPRDPRLMLLRRNVRIDISEDVLLDSWWQAQAVGMFRPARFRVLNRSDERELARALTWEIACGFGIGDGRPRAGLFDVEVAPDSRRKGLGRLLLTEVFRHSREQLTEIIAAQTPATNQAALAFYHALGFQQVETATLYRRPA